MSHEFKIDIANDRHRVEAETGTLRCHCPAMVSDWYAKRRISRIPPKYSHPHVLQAAARMSNQTQPLDLHAIEKVSTRREYQASDPPGTGNILERSMPL